MTSVEVTRPEPRVPETVDLGRWPRIRHALTVRESGYVDCDYGFVERRMAYLGTQGVERAETWEELATFYEWQLEQRTAELAKNPTLRYLVATWTDSMCYSLRRSATYARDEDPGPVIMQSRRRPDLFADRHPTEPRDRSDRSAVELAG